MASTFTARDSAVPRTRAALSRIRSSPWTLRQTIFSKTSREIDRFSRLKVSRATHLPPSVRPPGCSSGCGYAVRVASIEVTGVVR
jgi:hypothetical protein